MHYYETRLNVADEGNEEAGESLRLLLNPEDDLETADVVLTMGIPEAHSLQGKWSMEMHVVSPQGIIKGLKDYSIKANFNNDLSGTANALEEFA